jgi:hypothetical protein
VSAAGQGDPAGPVGQLVAAAGDPGQQHAVPGAERTVTGTVIAPPSSNCRFSGARRVSRKPGAAATQAGSQNRDLAVSDRDERP